MQDLPHTGLAIPYGTSGSMSAPLGHTMVPSSRSTPADGNIYEDLGFPPDEARNLKIRSMLMVTAKRFITDRSLTQAQAAELMGVSQPRISDLVRGRIGQFTIDSLINMLTNAGVPIEVRVAGKVA